MFRAVTVVVVGVAIAGASLLVSGCSGGGSASPYGAAPACPILAELTRTGQMVANADTADPTAFDRALRSAVATYVSTARRLREAVPDNLRPSVTIMIDAAERRDFEAAIAARVKLDKYARSNCKLEDVK
jgi:hypothetical protein